MNCDGNCAKCLPLANQPPGDREWTTEDGVFLKEMWLEHEGTIVPQHAHSYAHTSLLLRGSVQVVADGFASVFNAPAAIPIAAHVKHTFISLVDDTSVLCIHNLNGLKKPAIASEHQLTKGAI